MTPLKNIIFDLGEVFTDIYFDKTVEAFNELNNGVPIDLYSYKTQTPLFDEIETGKVSVEDFIAELKTLFGSTVKSEAIIEAWNALLGETPLEKLAWASSLRPKYQTFILSNTNAIHINWINNYLIKKYKVEGLQPFFDHVYFSHEIGFRKPDASAYEFILNKHNLKAEETLFIDDKLENIEAAQKLNIKTYHLVNKSDLFKIVT